MEPESRSFLRRLLEEPGVAGYEERAQRAWRAYVDPHVEAVTADPHGSLVARLSGRTERRIMLVGHIDEIGLIVKHVDEKGFLRVAAVGGIAPALLPSQRVRIVTSSGIVPGVVGTFADRKTDPKMRDVFVDIGAKDKEDALRRVELGDSIVVGEDWCDLGNGRVACRNFDNRVGCFIVAEVLREMSAREDRPVTLLGVSAVQEETGGVGAGQVANHWRPDEAIAFDVTWATDYPSTSVEEYGDIALGKGPVLIRGVRTSQRLYERLRDTARRHEIACQLETETGRTFTDADAISAQHSGIPVSVVSVPCRYMHSSCEVVSLDDVDGIVRLLVAYLSEFDANG